MTTNLNAHPAILAVDDDADDLDLLRLLLRKAGIPDPIEAYEKGEEVIAALSKLAKDSLKAIRPLLCFLDVKMAGLSGLDVLRWIRTQPTLAQMPVVMLSASEQPADVQQAAQNGAQCYLTKYPQPAVLREVVDDAARFALGAPAEDCFRFPSNQLLVRGRRLNGSSSMATHGARVK